MTSGPGSPGSNESTHTHTQFGLLLAQGAADLEAEPTQPRRAGVLAVLVGQHRQAERVRAPAPRHGRLRRAVRQGRARHPARRDRCFSVAKLFFAYGLGNALIFPFSVGATTILWPGPPTPQNVYAVDRDASADAVLLRADRLRDAAGAPDEGSGATVTRRGSRDFDLSSSASRCRRARRCRRRCTSASRSGSASTSSTASARPKRCTCSSRTGPGAIRPGSSGLLVDGYEARLLDDSGQPTPPGEIGNLWIVRRFGLRLLLEPAREDEEHDRGALDPDRRQVHAGRRRLLLVRGPHRRHAEGRRLVGQPGRSRERARRARRRCSSAASSAARITTAWSSRWRSSSCARASPATPDLGDGAAAVRARAARRVQASALGRVHPRAAEDRDRQDPALPAARRWCEQPTARLDVRTQSSPSRRDSKLPAGVAVTG